MRNKYSGKKSCVYYHCVLISSIVGPNGTADLWTCGLALEIFYDWNTLYFADTTCHMLLLSYQSCAENIKLPLRGCKEALLLGRTMKACE